MSTFCGKCEEQREEGVPTAGWSPASKPLTTSRNDRNAKSSGGGEGERARRILLVSVDGRPSVGICFRSRQGGRVGGEGLLGRGGPWFSKGPAAGPAGRFGRIESSLGSARSWPLGVAGAATTDRVDASAAVRYKSPSIRERRGENCTPSRVNPVETAGNRLFARAVALCQDRHHTQGLVLAGVTGPTSRLAGETLPS